MSMQNPFDQFDAAPVSRPSSAPPAFIPGTPKPLDPFKVEDQQMQRDAAARAERAADRADATANRGIDVQERAMGNKVYDNTLKLRGDYDALPAVKEYRIAVAQLSAGLKATPDATGDNALIYAYAKAMDPGSVVRESEMDMAASGASTADSTAASLKKQFGIDGGGQLPPQVRERLRREMLHKVTSIKASYDAQRQRFIADAQAFGIDPARVIGNHDGDAYRDEFKAYNEQHGSARPDAPRPNAENIKFGEDIKAPPGWRMTPEQTQQFSGYLKASGNATPEAVASAYKAITGGADISPEDAAEVAKYIANGGDPAKIGVDYSKADNANAEAIAKAQGPAGVQDMIVQGATLGMSDEASGVGNMAANAIASPFTDSEFDPVGSYTAGRDAERMRLDEARGRMGGAGTALEIGGSLLSGNVTNALMAAPTLGGRVAQGARAGAIGGGAAGFGYGEGAQNSLLGAAGGAAAGATLGAALPVAGTVIGNRVDGLRRLTGRDPALPRRLVNEAIEADGNTAGAAGQMMDEAHGRGSPMMLADTGENARGLLASVGRQPGPSRTIVRNAVHERQNAQAERISAAVVRDLGPTANIREMGEELIDRARTAASPLYDKALSAPGASSVKLDDLAMRPSFRKALYKAAEIAAEEGDDATALGFQFDGAGDVLLTRVPSFKTLDYIKRGLDDVVETYRDKTTGKLVFDGQGRATNASLRTLISRIDKVNPTYAEARAAYAGPAKMRDALDKGAKALNRSPDDIMSMLGNMGEGEQEAFRLGIRKSIVDMLASKRDGGDKVAALLGTPKSRSVLTRIFGGRGEFERFIATLRDEEVMGQTYRSVAGNSATAERMAQDAASNDTGLAETATDAALRGVRDGPWSALVDGIQRLREVERFGAGEAGQRAREGVAALLSETDPAVLRDLISAAQQAASQRGVRSAQRSRNAVRSGRVIGNSAGMGAGKLTDK